MRTIKHLCALILLSALALSLWPAQLTTAQTPIEVLESDVEFAFQKSITFALHAKSSAPIESITLYIRPTGQTAALRADPTFTPSTEVNVSHTLDTRKNYYPPGILFEYWWRIKDSEGNTLKTERQIFLYMDDRFTWNKLENDQIALFWHRDDQELGQELFEIASSAAQRLSEELEVTIDPQIHILVYNSQEELLGAVAEGSHEWIGGQSFGRQGVVVTFVDPDLAYADLSWAREVIPHELSHSVVAMAMKPPFGGLPRWLDEGLAMHAEMTSHSTEKATLQEAIKANELMSVRALSGNFPDDPHRASIAYAESYSLVEYLLDTYGQEKMAELIRVFADGAHYDDALKQVYGFDADRLYAEWRQAIGAPPLTEEPSSAPTSIPPAESTDQTTEESSSDTSSGQLPLCASPVLVALIALPVATRRRPRR